MVPDEAKGTRPTSYIQVPIASETNIAHNVEGSIDHKMKVRGGRPVARTPLSIKKIKWLLILKWPHQNFQKNKILK